MQFYAMYLFIHHPIMYIYPHTYISCRNHACGGVLTRVCERDLVHPTFGDNAITILCMAQYLYIMWMSTSQVIHTWYLEYIYPHTYITTCTVCASDTSYIRPRDYSYLRVVTSHVYVHACRVGMPMCTYILIQRVAQSHDMWMCTCHLFPGFYTLCT